VTAIGPAATLSAEVPGGQSIQPQAQDLPIFLAESRNAQDAVFAAVGDLLTLDQLGGP
jgi:hypothetical protein